MQYILAASKPKRKDLAMFCGTCGAEIEDDASFCGSCGTPVEAGEPQRAAAMPQILQPAAPVAVSVPAVAQAPGASKRNLIIIASALAAIIVILAIAAAVIILNQQEQKRVAPRPIVISISAADYSSACTKIPVNASGTDSKGNTVETTVFIDESGEGASLAPGEYELSFPASPLTPDGILYKPPSATATIVIDEDAGQDEKAHAFADTPATFTKSTALDETEQMIDDAYEYAVKDESQIAKADELKQTAQNAHQQAVNTEKERKEREAARLIDMPLYTVQIPEYWLGKVDIIKDGNTLKITAKGYPDGALVTVSAAYSPGSDEPDAMGDIGSSLMQYGSTANGYFVEMWAHRWTYTAASDAFSKFPSQYSTELKRTCIDLQTGGSVTLEQAEKTYPGSSEINGIAFAVDKYINSNVILKLKSGGPIKKTS